MVHSTGFQNKDIVALLLVGGFGTRLKPLTDNIPKPMLPANGKPILEYIIENCKQNGINNYIFTTHFLPEKITSYFNNGNKLGINIKYSQENYPLGSAGALKNSQKLLTNTFFVLNGDTYNEIDIKKLLKFHKKQKSLFTIVASSKLKKGDKVEFNSNYQVISFGDKESNSSYINGGFFIINKKILKLIPKNTFFSIEKDLIPKLVENLIPIYVYKSLDYIKDMGTIEDYKSLQNYIQAKSSK